MGLDWVLDKHRPRRGHERRYRALRGKLLAMKKQEDEDPVERAALEVELGKVSHSAMEEIGAPRIGIDASATRWFKKNVWAPEAERKRSAGEVAETFDVALEKARGQRVPALAREKGGLAGGSFLVTSLDYGAGLIDRCVDVLSSQLIGEAWKDHTAKEAADYARRLARAVRAARSPVELWKKRLAAAARARPAGPKIASSGKAARGPWEKSALRHGLAFEDQQATVGGLVRWLTFWSKRGYGFHAWS